MVVILTQEEIECLNAVPRRTFLRRDAQDALRGMLSSREAEFAFHALVVTARGTRPPHDLVIGQESVHRDVCREDNCGTFHIKGDQSAVYAGGVFRVVNFGADAPVARALLVSSHEAVRSRSHGVTVIPVELSAACLCEDALRRAYVRLAEENGEDDGLLRAIPLRAVRFGAPAL